MKRVALFVGVDEYEDGSISDLEYAVDDAEALAAVFETLLGFDRVEKLRNPEGKKEILGKVRKLTSGLGKGDLFFFFFAGHGFRVKENHVLVCRKDSYADLEDEYDGLPVGQLKKRMRGTWDRLLVIDACQNDIRKSRGGDEGISRRDLALILEDGEAAENEGTQVVVTSCSEGQKALEVKDLGHGLFASALLETVKEHVRTQRRLDMAVLREEMGGRMAMLARKYRLVGKQNPMFRIPGECGIALLVGNAGGESTLSGVDAKENANDEMPPAGREGASPEGKANGGGSGRQETTDDGALCISGRHDWSANWMRGKRPTRPRKNGRRWSPSENCSGKGQRH